MGKYCDVCQGKPDCPCCEEDPTWEAHGFRLDEDGFSVIDNATAEDAMCNADELPYKEYCFDLGVKSVQIDHASQDEYADKTNELGCAHAFADWMTETGADWICRGENVV